MLNKLSRKDIELLNNLAQTPEGKSALNEYIEQHEKAVKAYKIYRESVVAEVASYPKGMQPSKKVLDALYDWAEDKGLDAVVEKIIELEEL